MSVDALRRRRRRRLKIEEKRRKGESFGRRKSDDAPPTRAAVPSPALFSCTAAAVSRRAARPRPLVSRTPLCEYDDSSFLRSLVVLSSFDVRSSGAHKKRTNRKHTFYRERALLNINSNSKTQREKMGSLFFFVHKTLLSSRPLNDDDAEKRKGKEKRERRRSVLLLLSLSLCVCTQSRALCYL